MAHPIKVSDPVKATLDRIKEQEQHTSFDSALRAVLRDAGYEVG